jgi:hypothetical protein
MHDNDGPQQFRIKGGFPPGEIFRSNRNFHLGACKTKENFADSVEKFRLLENRLTVDAMEVLIKYCMNSFPQVGQFIRIQISFYFLCVSYWSIGSETKSNWLI